MAHVGDNIVAFHAKLNEFWSSEKYCDVEIQVQAKSYKCHRLALSIACDYFDLMFGGGRFHESRTNIVVLNEIDAISFEEVLRFIYKGDVILTAENVLNVLETSEFFKLNRIEDLCVRYIKTNPPIQDMLSIFNFARRTMRSDLISFASKCIMKSFEQFAEDEKFLTLSVEDLITLLSYRWYLNVKNDYLLVASITRWINYSRKNRQKHIAELVNMVDFAYISRGFMKHMLLTHLYASSEEISCDAAPPDLSANLDTMFNLGLHVYVNVRDRYGDSVELISFNRKHRIWDLLPILDEIDQIHCLKCTVLDNHLYYGITELNSLCPFIQRSSSIPMSFKGLNNPRASPILSSSSFNLCNFQSQLYLSDERTEKSGSVGLYIYHAERNDWVMGVPTRKRLRACTMTASDERLYLMAYEEPETGNGRVLLALDHRESKWHYLPSIGFIGIDAERKRHTCCTHQGKVYSYDGGSDIKCYDPVASKWQKIEISGPRHVVNISRMISYENALCVIDIDSSHELNYGLYSASTDEWMEWLRYPIVEFEDDDHSSMIERDVRFLDAVVFPYYCLQDGTTFAPDDDS